MPRYLKFTRTFALLAAFASGLAGTAAAQQAPATDTAAALNASVGFVRTAQGTGVPGASVRLTNAETHKSWLSWTDESGKFQFPGLVPGKYHIEATQLGFAPAALDAEIPFSAGRPLTITLNVATLAELEANPGAHAPGEHARRYGPGTGGGEWQRRPGAPVRGQAPPGQANAARPGISGGGFQQAGLTEEENGTDDQQEVGSATAAQNNGGGPGAADSGANASSDSFLLQGTVGQGLVVQGDTGGLSMGGPGRGGPGRGPGGRTFGGGGRGRFGRQNANRLRFSLYDRYENSALDARPYSITGAESPKVGHYDEHAGANVGGPLKIPHVYDGSDRTFVFVNYEHEIEQTSVNTFSTVPTLDERGGDFCGLTGVQLYDPYSNLTGSRTLLGNGCQIPATVPLDTAATKLLAYVPQPNLTGNVQNYLLQGTTPLNSDHVNFHLIHTINAKFGLNAGYNLSSQRSSTLGNFPDTGGTQSSLGQNFDLGVSHTWSPSLVEATEVNWSRNRTKVLSDNSYLNNIAGAAGINGVNTDPINYGIPGIGLTSFSGLNDPIPSLLRNQTLRFSDNLTWTHAKHTLKFGGEIRRIQLNTEADPLPRGQFTFTGLMTSQLDANGNPIPGTGNDFADFLLGLPYSTKTQFGPNAYFRRWDFIAYAQDDWRVTKRFTFEAGLRYEAVTPPVELYNHIANLDLNGDATQVDMVQPNGKGLYQGAYPRALVHGDYGNWAPRIGFAWQPFNFKPKIIVRGGYSIFYNVSSYNTLAQQYLAYQPPFATSQNLLTSGTQLLTLENGFPGSGLTVPNTGGVDPFYKDGYAQIWSLGTETTFAQNWLLDLTYTGTKGTNLDLLRAPNRAPLGTNPLNTQTDLQIPYATSFYYDQSGANSIYNALQVRIMHHYTKGLLLLGTYTFGKSLDNASSIGGSSPVVVQQDGNYAAQYGLSSFDVRHQVRVFSMYEIPFGEHHRFATYGWKKHALGEWRLMNMVTWQTGTPTTPLLGGIAANNSGTGANFSERPDQIGNPNLGICGGSSLAFFNTAAFAAPPAAQYGNAQRNSIEGPCHLSWNISLAKAFRFGPEQRHRIDARWDVQNLTNSPSFSGLSTTLGSSSFGRVTSAGSMRTMNFQIRFNY